jgi:hypothetical protein
MMGRLADWCFAAMFAWFALFCFAVAAFGVVGLFVAPWPIALLAVFLTGVFVPLGLLCVSACAEALR